MKKTLIITFAICGAMANAQSFFESFDSGPTGFSDGTVVTFGNTSGGDAMTFSSGTWHALNNSSPLGSTGWHSTNGGFAPNSGTGQLNADAANTDDGTIDNYMMSPVRTFSNGDTISFFTRALSGSAFPDRLYLKMSLNGASTSVADFSTLLLEVNSGLFVGGYPETWTMFSTTITGLGSPTSGRFALNYNVTHAGINGANSEFIGIDDVRYSAVPEPASMIILGLGAAALAARRRKNKTS